MACRRLPLLLAVVGLLGAYPGEGRPAAVGSLQQDEPVLRGRKLSEWLRMLRGEEGQRKRQTALLALGCAGNEPLLWQSLSAPRRAGLIAAELIGPVRAREIIPAICTALRLDPDPPLRQAAAQALGRMAATALEEGIRYNEARDALIAALRLDWSDRVREAAAASLGKLDPVDARDAVPVLAQALGDPSTRVRSAAADTLRRLGKSADEAIPALVKVIQDPQAQSLTRMQAALALGRIGGSAAAEGVPALQGVAADREAPPDVRVAAAESLATLDRESPATARVLGGMLATTDADVRVRRAAVAALDQMGAAGRAVLPALLKALDDEDRFVRALAIHSISQMGPQLADQTPAVVTALLRAIEDRALDVRLASVETLGLLGAGVLGKDAERVRTRLEQLARDSGVKEIREAAASALVRLKS